MNNKNKTAMNGGPIASQISVNESENKLIKKESDDANSQNTHICLRYGGI